MRLKSLILIVSATAGLGGCLTGQDVSRTDPFLYRDPLVNGPFLIGAQRPSLVQDDCRPLGEIRSQDSRVGYRPCPKVHPYNGAINPQDPPVGIVTEAVVPVDASADDGRDLKDAPPKGSRRSAW